MSFNCCKEFWVLWWWSSLLGSLGSSVGGVLSLDDGGEFVSNELSAFVRTSSLASETDGLLLLGGVTSLEHLHHLALEGGKSSHLSHNLADGQESGVGAALALGLLLLESVGVSLGLGHNVSLVQTDKNSTFLHHLISFKIIKCLSLCLLNKFYKTIPKTISLLFDSPT